MLESIRAIFLPPQLCHILHSELPKLSGASLLLRKTRPKANSSFILKIMEKSVCKRLKRKLGKKEYGDVLCA